MPAQIIIPLDGMEKSQALEVVSNLCGLDGVWGFKVNDLLAEGYGIIQKLKEFSAVMADPKFFDIPNTVANCMKKITEAGADLITVHALGGIEMMKAAVSQSQNSRVVGVTVLTSFIEEEAHLLYGAPIKAKVLQLARNICLAGVQGIVCSPQELKILSGKEFSSLVKITPGIRPEWHQKKDDQARTMMPREAVELGANLLVIGRPILKASDPKEAVERTIMEMRETSK